MTDEVLDERARTSSSDEEVRTDEVAPGRLRWFSGELRTGRITTYLPLAGTTWSAGIDDTGAMGGTLHLADPEVADLLPRVTAAPAKCFLGVAYIDDTGTEYILQAGPIWQHSYNDDTGALAIGAAGIWSYYDHRQLLAAAAIAAPQAWSTQHVGGMSLLAKKLVQLAHEHTGGSVPIVLPADEAGTFTRSYKGSELALIGDALRNLTDGDNAVEVMFVPRRQAADPRYLEWVLRVGTTAAPTLTQPGADHVWNVDVAQPSMSTLSVNLDGSAIASRQWSPGSGSETEKVIGKAANTSLIDQGYPLLEATVANHENVELKATADAYASQALARSQAPVEAWDATVRRDAEPRLGSYSPGDWVTFAVRRHRYLAAGRYRTRLVGISGDDSANVKLQLAATIGGL